MDSGPEPSPTKPLVSSQMSSAKRQQSSDDDSVKKRRRIDSVVAEAGPSARSRKKGKGKARATENASPTSPIASGSKPSPSALVQTFTLPKALDTPSPCRHVHLRVQEAQIDQDQSEMASMSPVSLVNGMDNELQRELARLKQELATKNELLSQHQDTFTSLQGMLTCQICLELMWDPYTTACGHTACVKCLQDWFRQPAPPDPNFAPGHPRAAHLKRKTCPTCRASVRFRPTPLFAVRSILGAVSSSLDPELVATKPIGIPIAPGGTPVDPWQGIFAKDDFPDRGPLRYGALIDHEDGVMRCRECLFEIVDGVCENCGALFDEHDHLGSEGSDIEEDLELPAWVFHPNRLLHAPHSDEDEDDDGESQTSTDSSGGSFIDNRDEVPLPARVGAVIRQLARRPARQGMVLSDDPTSGSEDSVVNERRRMEREMYGEDDFVVRRSDHSDEDSLSEPDSVNRSPSPPPRPRRTRNNPPIIISEDEDEDGDEDMHNPSEGSRSRVRDVTENATTLQSADSDQESASSGSIPAGRYVRRRRPSYGHTSWTESDDDE